MRQLPEDLRKIQAMKAPVTLRHHLLKLIRDYFDDNDFIEVSTPLVINAPAPEEYIEAPKTVNGFLRPSPELQMKRMIAAGYQKIYQIGPCFRQGELGRLHNPEFTMLEWYQTGIDYVDLLDFTRDLLRTVVNQLTNKGLCESRSVKVDFNGEWQIITVADAFATFADLSPEKAIEEDCFEETLVEKIEPHLGVDVPAILIDYPAKHAALSKRKAGNPRVAERWELYLNGIEIANAYTELTDPTEQRQRFATFAETRKQTGYQEYPEPTRFYDALDYGMPECAGCALGLDRLIMILAGANTIHDVIFPE